MRFDIDKTESRRHQKCETGVSVAPKMDMYPTKIKKKTEPRFLGIPYNKGMKHHLNFPRIKSQLLINANFGSNSL